MKGGGILILAGGGLLAYYLYTKYGSGILPGGSVTPVTGGTLPVTGGASPGSTTTAPAFDSLAAIYARMAAKNGTKLFTPYQWNYELGQEFAGTQPDTLDGITDWTVPISLNAYWSAASSWLRANDGLSGLAGVWSV